MLKHEATSSPIELPPAHEEEGGELLLPSGQHITTEGSPSTVPCTQSPGQGCSVWRKRRVEAHLCYSRKQGVNLSEKLTM